MSEARPRTVTEGMVVQLAPDCPSMYRGSFAVVTKADPDAIEADVLVPHTSGPQIVLTRVPYRSFAVIGQAFWALQEAVENQGDA